jgi:hypothetical protein
MNLAIFAVLQVLAGSSILAAGDIGRITWGPINTCCEGPVSEYFGLVRSDDTTLGMMSLEPNTEGLRLSFDIRIFLPSAKKETPNEACINLYTFQPIRKK